MRKALLILSVSLLLLSHSAFSGEATFAEKCRELGGESNMISCHQTTDTYQDDEYNLMITELEAACLETNNGDTRSFVVSDVWSFETNNYDVRSYCFCFDQDN